jgi:hypothetical protein
VVELVDAEDSKSSASDGVRVQVSPPAPSKIKGLSQNAKPLFYWCFSWNPKITTEKPPLFLSTKKPGQRLHAKPGSFSDLSSYIGNYIVLNVAHFHII